MLTEEIYAIVIKITGDQPTSKLVTEAISALLAKLQPEGENLLAVIQPIIENAEVCCSEGGDYEVCHPSVENPIQVSNEIISKLSPYLLQAKEEREEINNIPNPYSKEFFPDSIKEVGKILKDKGLTDRELTSVSGVLARLGWDNAMRKVRQALSSPATEKEKANE